MGRRVAGVTWRNRAPKIDIMIAVKKVIALDPMLSKAQRWQLWEAAKYVQHFQLWSRTCPPYTKDYVTEKLRVHEARYIKLLQGMERSN